MFDNVPRPEITFQSRFACVIVIIGVVIVVIDAYPVDICVLKFFYQHLGNGDPFFPKRIDVTLIRIEFSRYG